MNNNNHIKSDVGIYSIQCLGCNRNLMINQKTYRKT